MVDIDSEALFTGGAALVSTIAALVFIFNVDLGYSPISTALIVVGFMMGVFAITQRTEEYQLRLFGYGVIVVTSVGLLVDLVSMLGGGEIVTVLGLLLIAGGLFAARAYFDDDSRFTTGRRATYAFWGIAMLVAVVVATDVFTGGLSYALQPDNQVEYPATRSQDDIDQLTVGSVVARNPTPLPERVEMPQYGACAAGDWSAYKPTTDEGEPAAIDIELNVEDAYGDYVMSYSTNQYPLQLYLHGTNLQGETFPIRVTADCPTQATGAPYIALYQRNEEGSAGRPV